MKISGDVQGVGYRFFAVDEARALNVFGYTRNTPDGGVEVVGEGEKNSLEQLVNSLKAGPACSPINAQRKRRMGTLRGTRTESLEDNCLTIVSSTVVVSGAASTTCSQCPAACRSTD